MTPDEFAELCRLKREAWQQRIQQQGSNELPKPPAPEPLPAGQGQLW